MTCKRGNKISKNPKSIPRVTPLGVLFSGLIIKGKSSFGAVHFEKKKSPPVKTPEKFSPFKLLRLN
jgi:hypothetical protein